MFEEIRKQAEGAIRELLDAAKLQPGDLLVIGCSSSEIMGEKIGKGSSMEAAEAVYAGIAPVLAARGVLLAAQCCEHLNRAIVTEREAAGGADIVNAVPVPKAGGSFAATAYRRFADPVVLEEIRADAGIDIGDTLIGMHLKKVAVPVRLQHSAIGSAHLTAARVRPKFIGGQRAVYDEDLK